MTDPDMPIALEFVAMTAFETLTLTGSCSYGSVAGQLRRIAPRHWRATVSAGNGLDERTMTDTDTLTAVMELVRAMDAALAAQR